MTQVTDPAELTRIATEATQNLRRAYLFYGVAEEAPVISPGMVQCVLKVAGQDGAAVQPQSHSGQDSAKPPETSKRRHKRDSQDVSEQQFCAFLRRIAIDDMLPSIAAYNDQRPDGWPTAQTLLTKFGCKWSELAGRAGLELSERQRASRDIHNGSEAPQSAGAVFRSGNGHNG